MQDHLNYTSQVILSILFVAIIIIFYVRKKMVGAIIGTASTSRIRFFYLIMALFMLYLGFKGLYNAFHYQGYMSNLSIYMFITNLLITASFLIVFFTSRIHIGLKGVSVPAFPLFISHNKIIDYEVECRTLVLKRKEKKDYKIIIEINDVKNIESAIGQLKNKND